MRRTVHGSRTKGGSVAKIINNTKIFGIMGGLAPMRNISASTHVAYRVGDARIHQDIPLDAKRGLAYMLGQNPMGKYMLSRNPQCAGGIGRMALVSGRGAYTTPTREKVVFIPTGFPKNLGASLGGADGTPYITDSGGTKWTISEWPDSALQPYEVLQYAGSVKPSYPGDLPNAYAKALGFTITSAKGVIYYVVLFAVVGAMGPDIKAGGVSAVVVDNVTSMSSTAWPPGCGAGGYFSTYDDDSKDDSLKVMREAGLNPNSHQSWNRYPLTYEMMVADLHLPDAVDVKFNFTPGTGNSYLTNSFTLYAD